MAIKTAQIATVNGSSVNVLGAGGFTFGVSDVTVPIQVVLYNVDTTNDIWIGGPSVTNANGLIVPHQAGTTTNPPVTLTLYLNDFSTLYAYATTGTPKLHVLATRQN
jgi:hypothetical protein